MILFIIRMLAMVAVFTVTADAWRGHLWVWLSLVFCLIVIGVTSDMKAQKNG